MSIITAGLEILGITTPRRRREVLIGLRENKERAPSIANQIKEILDNNRLNGLKVVTHDYPSETTKFSISGEFPATDINMEAYENALKDIKNLTGIRVLISEGVVDDNVVLKLLSNEEAWRQYVTEAYGVF